MLSKTAMVILDLLKDKDLSAYDMLKKCRTARRESEEIINGTILF